MSLRCEARAVAQHDALVVPDVKMTSLMSSGLLASIENSTRSDGISSPRARNSPQAAAVADLAAHRGTGLPTSRTAVRIALCNGMTGQRRTFTLSLLCGSGVRRCAVADRLISRAELDGLRLAHVDDAIDILGNELGRHILAFEAGIQAEGHS